MSASNHNIAAATQAEATMVANKAASSASAYPASSADSVYSDSSFPVKDSDACQAAARSSKSKASGLKNWAKGIVSDLGKPPTYKYDAAHGNDSKLDSTSAWADNRPTKI